MVMLALTLLGAAVPPNIGQAEVTDAEQRSVQRRILTTAEMFEWAGHAASAGDAALAERIFRTIAQNPDVKVRSEARFRLSMMFTQLGRFSDAAMLLRDILDEQPDAQRARFELARVLELMGDEAGARKALREVQAGGLPPAVARLVDRYSNALRSRKPIGATIELSIAPDTNINRATRSDTLGTVIGDFIVDEDAKQKSGIGGAVRGQFYARSPISTNINLVARINGGANLYKRDDFNDLSVALVAGPEIISGNDRISIDAGVGWRWYGGSLFSENLQFGINFLHPIGDKSQLRLSLSALEIDNRRNSLQDGQTYQLVASFERALNSTTGIGVTLLADRQKLRDPGYSTTGGQIYLSGYREMGATTLFATLGHGRSYADARLSLFPEKRKDRLFLASLGASFRQLRLWSLAPVIRLNYERNHSTTEIYDYKRFRAEIGVTRAF